MIEQRWAVDFNKFACESVALNHPETKVMVRTTFFFSNEQHLSLLLCT